MTQNNRTSCQAGEGHGLSGLGRSVEGTSGRGDSAASLDGLWSHRLAVRRPLRLAGFKVSVPWSACAKSLGRAERFQHRRPHTNRRVHRRTRGCAWLSRLAAIAYRGETTPLSDISPAQVAGKGEPGTQKIHQRVQARRLRQN